VSSLSKLPAIPQCGNYFKKNSKPIGLLFEKLTIFKQDFNAEKLLS